MVVSRPGRAGDLPGRRDRGGRPVVFCGVSGPRAMLAGCLLLLAGAVLTLAAIQTTSAAAFLAGVAVAAGSLIVRGRSPVPGTRSSGGTSQ